MDTPILGSLFYFGGNFAPYQTAQCNGQLLPIRQYTALFSLLGINFGGDGKTTFGLPDLRGRKVIGQSDQYPVGDAEGSESTTLTILNLAAHTHAGSVQVRANSDGSSTSDPTNNYPSLPDNGGCYQQQATQNTTMAPAVLGLAPAGGGQPFSHQNPFLAVTVCIIMSGVFPQRP